MLLWVTRVASSINWVYWYDSSKNDTSFVRALNGLYKRSQLKLPRNINSFSSKSSLIKYCSRLGRHLSPDRSGGIYQVVIINGLVNGFLISKFRISINPDYIRDHLLLYNQYNFGHKNKHRLHYDFYQDELFHTLQFQLHSCELSHQVLFHWEKDW